MQKLQYVGANIPEIVREGLQTSLAEIEEELVEKRSKYTEDCIDTIESMGSRESIDSVESIANTKCGTIAHTSRESTDSKNH